MTLAQKLLFIHGCFNLIIAGAFLVTNDFYTFYVMLGVCFLDFFGCLYDEY